MKKYISMYVNLLGIAGVVVALDQWTKWLVRENIPFATQWLPESMRLADALCAPCALAKQRGSLWYVPGWRYSVYRAGFYRYRGDHLLLPAN